MSTKIETKNNCKPNAKELSTEELYLKIKAYLENKEEFTYIDEAEEISEENKASIFQKVKAYLVNHKTKKRRLQEIIEGK
ncbi:MAG: hypothetical protein ACWA41_02305 [Putridiphycobacter sp.]